MKMKYIVFLLLVGAGMGATPSAVLVANSIDYSLSSNFVAFLQNEGIDVTRITADEFDDYKEEKFIVILGGPDAPEGVGEIVREALSETNREHLRRRKGNRNMYVQTATWKVGQVVMVVAGYDREDTQTASFGNRNDIAKRVGNDLKLSIGEVYTHANRANDDINPKFETNIAGEKLVVIAKPSYKGRYDEGVEFTGEWRAYLSNDETTEFEIPIAVIIGDIETVSVKLDIAPEGMIPDTLCESLTTVRIELEQHDEIATDTIGSIDVSGC